MELVSKRDNLKRKAILNNFEQDWFNYKTSKNEVNIKLRNAKLKKLVYYAKNLVFHMNGKQPK